MHVPPKHWHRCTKRLQDVKMRKSTIQSISAVKAGKIMPLFSDNKFWICVSLLSEKNNFCKLICVTFWCKFSV
jgi:hypothetical protein